LLAASLAALASRFPSALLSLALFLAVLFPLAQGCRCIYIGVGVGAPGACAGGGLMLIGVAARQPFVYDCLDCSRASSRHPFRHPGIGSVRAAGPQPCAHDFSCPHAGSL